VGKGDEEDLDALFQLSPPEFVSARNALAAELKKAGRDDVASRVKALPKPSISAWTVNQLYWRHRAAFEKLLATGERFRQAQASKLAGRNADLHRLLNERREELSAMARLAVEILQRSSGSAPSGVTRRITATLEALSAYGTLAGAPRAGRLTEDVDPPGFDALSALVPRVGDDARASVPSRVLAFQKEITTPPKKGKARSAEDKREKEKQRQAQLAAARAAKQDASRALVSARRMAQQAQTALKKAATRAKETEETMVATEERLTKVASIAHEARQKARRAAVEAETAAQAAEEAERTLERATRELAKLEEK
jgi:DNA repair exonuclease SbcCD ATPase subunit